MSMMSTIVPTTIYIPVTMTAMTVMLMRMIMTVVALLADEDDNCDVIASDDAGDETQTVFRWGESIQQPRGEAQVEHCLARREQAALRVSQQ